ncbi:MAG: hypothetical protein LC749_00630 [Actinobacteria bacterium]|nr:hypothetical protein [Actinomycetota bacterium]
MLLGKLLTATDGRPAHLTRVHRALVCLPGQDQRRLAVQVQAKSGPHLLSYRQVEYTFGLVCGVLSRPEPDGTPSEELCEIVDALLEASVAERYKDKSSSLAVDWSDLETFAKGPPKEQKGKDPDASWGRRRGQGPGETEEKFFGYFLQTATMVKDERGPAVPELARRILVTACSQDPVPAFVPVLQHMHASGIQIGDVLADCGYSFRTAEKWAAPLRAIGAKLVQDMHPGDRGTKGTYKGATIFHGRLYCPATPEGLLQLGPAARDFSKEQFAEHDKKSALLSSYKLGRISGDDADGYHRVMCPAAMGKIRCPLRKDSMTLPLSKPEVLTAPQPAPVCCTQKTITVPPAVCAKTAQKHDYPSKAHRQSYNRRTGAERTFASIKDPARNDISRGWCRVMGVAPTTLFVACLFVARNLRTTDSFERRQAAARAKAASKRTRPKRRKTLADLAGSAAGPSP